MLNIIAVNRAVTPRFIRATNGGPLADTKSITYPSIIMINNGIRLFITVYGLWSTAVD